MMHDYFHININSTYSCKYSERARSTTNVRQYHTITTTLPGSHIKRNTSFVVGQKLRESKWFTQEEIKIFCAVVENGFIVQKKDERGNVHWGIAMWKHGFEKSKDPENITIYNLVECKGHYKVEASKLLEFWHAGTLIKIDNHHDKEQTANKEEVIKNKISYAQKHKLKWHNTEHFVYWCRYLQSKTDRSKPVSDDMKWLNPKISVCLQLLKGKRKTSQ